MALCTSTDPGAATKTRFFDLDRARDAGSRGAAAYRCGVCGGEQNFDSLAACCQCCDECYPDSRSAPALQCIQA
jgi:hypothetical protein